jgi:4-diphosphocytidyl-2-C-methyl-D-erythritol kinase
LRIANELTGRPLAHDELLGLAAELGSDVPSQVDPRHAFVHGFGERVEVLALPRIPVVLVPDADGLSTAAVYAELDRLGGWRAELDPSPVRQLGGADAAELAAALENDLQPAALSLRPGLAERLEKIGAAGALGAAVSGSGPTCFGLFTDRPAAEGAAASIPGALVTELR